MAPRISLPARPIASTVLDQSPDVNAARSSATSAWSSVAIALFSLQECVPAPLKNPLDLVPTFINGSDLLEFCVLPVGSEYKHPFGIAENRYVRIVSDKDHLPCPFNRLKRADDCLVDECVIEVVFGLINKQRAFALRKEDRQNRGTALSRGQVS